MAKGKGKGKGRGRGRPKESSAVQQVKPVEPGIVRTVADLPEVEQSLPNKREPAQSQMADDEFPPISGGSSLQNQFPQGQTQVCHDQEEKKPVQLHHGGTRPKQMQRGSDMQNPFGPVSNEQGNLSNLPSGSKLKEKSRSGADKLQNENFHHDKTELPTKSRQENDISGVMNLASSYNQTAEMNFPNNTQNGSLAVVPRLGEPQQAQKTNILRRPDFGIAGRKMEVIANYFLLQGRGNPVYHYDIEIVEKGRKNPTIRTIGDRKKEGATMPEIQQERSVGKQKCREIVSQLIRQAKLQKFQPFYDGQKNLYSFKRFLTVEKKKTVEVILSSDGKKKSYMVTVQSVNRDGDRNDINLELLNQVCRGGVKDIPHEAVMAFDMILCHREPPIRQISVGRSFFPLSEIRKKPLDSEVEVWKGYSGRVHLTQRGPAVVVNLATKAIHTAGFVIDYACDLLGFDITNQKLENSHIQMLSASLNNVKVEVTHLSYPRRYVVRSVTMNSAEVLTIDVGNENVSVAEYFSRKYRALKFPGLPCLAMKSTGKPTYTPMEFCIIPPGQPKLGKLSGRQTSDMMNMAAIPPEDRFQQIRNYAKVISDISKTYMCQSGLNMELEPMNLTARVISAPALTYKNETLVQPDNRGVWRIDGKSFTTVVHSRVNWCLISFADSKWYSDVMLQNLSTIFVQASRKVGLQLNDPLAIEIFDKSKTTDVALSFVKRLRVDFAFVVVSRNDKHHSYDEVKFIADIKLGLVTQCMEDVVVKKCCEGQGSGQILNNICSKLNIKLGGINHKLSQQHSVSMNGTIVMGADAAHSPRGSKCPSIAAVVGSVDDVPFQYAVSCRVQRNPDKSKFSQEIILDMKEMTKHALKSYRKNNGGRIPQKIVFFRDGVSEGQFEIILKMELSMIQAACQEILNKQIPVTFIIVQKRHQTRFIPRRPGEGVGRGKNVPPGTTVDTDVVHPVYFDFFICSHEGIKGTSKPAHYVVLHDDNEFKADELQRFCYELCHVYARCNRSISIPAPAMNAHLAAARAKKYVDWHISKDAGSSSGYSSDDLYSVPDTVIDYVNNISTIKTPMFFV